MASRTFVLLVAATTVSFACADGTPGTAPSGRTPTAAPPVAGALRGTVDLSTGVLTFEQIPARNGAAGVSTGPNLAIYGDQGVTAQLYNTAVAVDSVTAPGMKRWSGDVGIRNLLTHAIGDEQAGLSSADTMGIHVFFVTEPVVVEPLPCAGCAVTIRNAHGTGTFDAPNRTYFFWPERVSAGDTTRTRKRWEFEAPSQVRRFSFDVLVSAAWPPPTETRWKVQLNNDSLPDTQEEPRWRSDVVGTNNTYSASGGILTLQTAHRGVVRFYRRDSVGAAGSAYVEARLISSSANANRPETRIVIDDGARFIGLGIARTSAWFTDSSATFLPGTQYPVAATAAYRVYQLRKYGADSAVFYVDGTRGGALPYASFPLDAGVIPRIVFGNRGITGSSGSSWDYVIYELGVPVP